MKRSSSDSIKRVTKLSDSRASLLMVPMNLQEKDKAPESDGQQWCRVWTWGKWWSSSKHPPCRKSAESKLFGWCLNTKKCSQNSRKSRPAVTSRLDARKIVVVVKKDDNIKTLSQMCCVMWTTENLAFCGNRLCVWGGLWLEIGHPQ